MEIKQKKAAFFTTDALVAILIIFLVVLIAAPSIKQTEIQSNIDQDVISALSSLKVSEIDSPYVQQLISQGEITDTNQTLIEQLGEFYITNQTIAKDLASEFLSSLDTKENIGIWFENTLLASKNETSFENAKQIDTSRQVISGIQSGENISGFSARAFLSNNLQNKYFYFGGYVGDGNISTNIEYTGNISSAKMEIAINNDFSLYINGIFVGNYSKSADDFTPQDYDIPIAQFSSGTNIIEIRGTNIHIAGGFIRISYENTGEYTQSTKKYLPGISGIINLYDGLTIPGQLDDLNIFLHLNSNYSIFAALGNTTIFEGSTDGEQTISLDNSQLSNSLDYSKLSNKTTPLRITLENVNYIVNGTKEADIFSVTDLSGSMADSCIHGTFFCCWLNGWCSTQNTCNSCGGNWDERLGLAKEANNILIESILNNTDNRVGLAGYKEQAYLSDYHELSDDVNSLESKVEQWTAEGNTCICCGINKAVQGFQSSSDDKLKQMIVMSDGIANRQCSEQGTGSAINDAIQAACEAYQDHNITVHAVGFGDDADEQTLQSIAACGNGSYYFADVNELAQLYQQIAEDIISGTYIEQTIELEGDLQTELYPDSYIQFGYNQTTNPFGLILTEEKQFSTPYEGSFSIPENSSLIEATAISYSGARWTDSVKINSNPIYSLTDYGTNFTKLGDPYSIKIPNSFVQENNTVEITTSASAGNSTQGSIYNKIIYTIIKEASGFSPIVSLADGCTWTLEFEDNTNLTANIPSDYSGTEQCSYTESSIQYNLNDAVQIAVFKLLKELDTNSNGKLDVKFTEQDLQIDLSEIEGIPFPWSTEVQVRRWI